MGCASSASATVKKYKVKVAAEDEKEVLKDELAKKEEALNAREKAMEVEAEEQQVGRAWR